MSRVPNLSPIALIAGTGSLPHLLVDVFKAQNHPFVVLALKNQAEDHLVEENPHLWISFGEIGKALAYLKENKIKRIVMAGAVSRPALSDIKADWEGVKWLARLAKKALGDDSLLKALIELIEECGYQIVAPDQILAELLAPEGQLTSVVPDDQAWRDIGRGLDVLSALGPVDVGQAIVVQENLVLGIEAIEGTDALIKRVNSLQRPGRGGVLVKITKHTQDHRVDLPTIGPETIRRASQSGLRGIAIEAGKTLLLNREETLALAEEKKLFLVALGHNQCHRHL